MKIIYALMCAALMAAGPAWAQSEEAPESKQLPSGAVFHWYDASGNLHVTDQIDDVPTDQRAAAVERVLNKEELPGGSFSVIESDKSAPVDTGPTVTAPRDQDPTRTKDYWQNLLEEQRTLQADALAEVERLENELTRVKAIRPAGFHETLPRLEKEIAAQKAIAAEAEVQLKTGIPERARKADIPPGWLR